MQYKLIVLIIKSNNIEIYSEMIKLGRLYQSLFIDVKFFYVEYKDIQNNVIEDNDCLYFNGTESFIPGIYIKTLKAIEYINNNYDYDFILRTNLSSFLNLYNILKFLDSMSKINFAGGFMPQGFASGTGIFMSRDVGNLLVQNFDNSYIGDDILISNVISRNNINMIDIITYKLGFLTSYDESNLPNNCCFINMGDYNNNIKFPDDILYFRIRNDIDRNIDTLYFKLLLKKIYNIDSDSNIHGGKDTVSNVVIV